MIIIPCAGKSTRFPKTRPKYLLTNPSGKLMIEEVALGNNLAIGILKEHDDKYNASNIVKKVLPKANIVIINKTKNQLDTVKQIIDKLNITGNIFIKDCDSNFKINEIYKDYNYICVSRLDRNSKSVTDKSYILGDIDRIVEKQVISDTFSVGGYYFTDASMISNKFEYPSGLIQNLIDNGTKFKKVFIKDYQDWNDYDLWIDYKNKHATYFIDIDGVLFENGSRYFPPFWGLNKPIKENIEKLKQLKRDNAQIILVTARTDNYSNITEKQLLKNEIKYDRIIYGVNHSQRIMVNDYSSSNPFPSALAINIERNCKWL